MSTPKTIFLDIDGCLLKHAGNLVRILATENEQKLLDGVHEKLNEWERQGYNIVLTTGRKESMRQTTERQLARNSIFYDQLIMGLGGGERHLVNDAKPNGKQTAFAHNLVRDEGLGNLEI